jgi:hypothetical protein
VIGSAAAREQFGLREIEIRNQCNDFGRRRGLAR